MTDSGRLANRLALREGARCSRAGQGDASQSLVLRSLCAVVLRCCVCVIDCNGRVAGVRHWLPSAEASSHPYSLAEESGELINAYLSPFPSFSVAVLFMHFFHFSHFSTCSCDSSSSSLVDRNFSYNDATHDHKPAMSSQAKLPSPAPK